MTSEGIEAALARLDERVRGLIQIAEGVKYTAQQVNKNAERIAVHDERFDDMRRDLVAMEARMEAAVTKLEAACNSIGDQTRSFASELNRTLDDARMDFNNRLTATTTAKINGRYVLYAALSGGGLAILAKLAGIG